MLADQEEPREQQRALRFAQANATRYPQSAEAAGTLGWAYQRLGQADEAEAALNRALTAGTLSADCTYFVADLFERQGRREEAATLATKALESTVPFLYRAQARETVERCRSQIANTAACRGCGEATAPSGHETGSEITWRPGIRWEP